MSALELMDSSLAGGDMHLIVCRTVGSQVTLQNSSLPKFLEGRGDVNRV